MSALETRAGAFQQRFRAYIGSRPNVMDGKSGGGHGTCSHPSWEGNLKAHLYVMAHAIEIRDKGEAWAVMGGHPAS